MHFFGQFATFRPPPELYILTTTLQTYMAEILLVKKYASFGLQNIDDTIFLSLGFDTQRMYIPNKSSVIYKITCREWKLDDADN